MKYSMSDVRPMNGINCGRSAADFPALKLCWAMDNAATVDTVVDEVLGIGLERSTGLWIPDGSGSNSVAGTSGAPTTIGTLPSITFQNKSILWLGFFENVDTLGEAFEYGESYNTGPGIGMQPDTPATYAIRDVSNFVGNTTSVPIPSTVTTEPVALAVCHQYATTPTKSLMVGAATARDYNGATIDTLGSLNGAALAPYNNQITIPTRGANCYGILLFQFDRTTLSDWADAVEWMYHDWIPKSDGTPGEKRIYPPWKGKT